MRHTDSFLFVLAFATLQGVACSSNTPATGAASDTEATDPGITPPVGSSGSTGAPPAGSADPPGSSGSSGAIDAGPDSAPVAIDAGSDSAPVDAGPPAFTQAEVQALVNARCAPCHVGGMSAGMSLAGDFTTATVGVASTQLPSMKRIQAGSKSSSYLFNKISGTHAAVGGSGLRMPRNGPPYLSDLDIERIGKYIDGL